MIRVKSLLKGPAGPKWKFVGLSTTVLQTAAGNITITHPAAAVAGDLLVAVFSQRSSPPITEPAGSIWVKVGETTTGGNGTNNTTASGAAGAMFYGIRGAGAPALTFTRAFGGFVLVKVIAYRHVDAASPLVASRATLIGTAATDVNGATVISVNNDDLIVMASLGARPDLCDSFRAATRPSVSSGAGAGATDDPKRDIWQERFDEFNTAAPQGSIALADAVIGTPGATGTLTYTHGRSARHSILAGVFKQAP